MKEAGGDEAKDEYINAVESNTKSLLNKHVSLSFVNCGRFNQEVVIEHNTYLFN